MIMLLKVDLCNQQPSCNTCVMFVQTPGETEGQVKFKIAATSSTGLFSLKRLTEALKKHNRWPTNCEL